MYDDTPSGGDSLLVNEGDKMEAACDQNPFPPPDRYIVANGDVTVKFTMTKNDSSTR